MFLVKSFNSVRWDFTQNVLLVAKGQGCRSSHSRATSHWSVLVVRQFWARAYQAHVAAQHVVELRKFIHFEAAQQISYRGNPGVSFCRVARAAYF